MKRRRTLPEDVFAKQTQSDYPADSSPERAHPSQSDSQTGLSGGTANNSIVAGVMNDSQTGMSGGTASNSIVAGVMNDSQTGLSGGTANNSIVAGVMNDSQTGMSGGTANNSIVAGVMNVSEGRSPLQNLIAETIQKIKSINKHVSTHTEDVTYRHLTEKGCVVIRGRSGSGKSHLGYTLLQRVSKAFSRKPVKISSPEEWNYIPKRNDMTVSSVKPTVPKSGDTSNYVVMIDDIFGSSNLIQHNLDQWRQKFDLVWPSVENDDVQESWCHSKKHHQLLKSLRDREGPVQMPPQTVSVLLQRAAWKQCKECVSIFLSQSGVTATDDNGSSNGNRPPTLQMTDHVVEDQGSPPNVRIVRLSGSIFKIALLLLRKLLDRPWGHISDTSVRTPCVDD
ncbi:uncharacterized protein [Haliotis cracherodii]|uniref:uncharacterized protein n=1 Tax=Haliotis cracherodii TaxID=6455 RepID=UPI0039EA9B67